MVVCIAAIMKGFSADRLSFWNPLRWKLRLSVTGGMHGAAVGQSFQVHAQLITFDGGEPMLRFDKV